MSSEAYQQYEKKHFEKVNQCKRYRVTWRQLLTGAEWPHLPQADNEPYPQVYAILDSTDKPVYVGGSTDVFDRLMTHVGRGNFSWAQEPSPVGRYIIDMAPASVDWGIELLCLRKCDEPWAIRLYNPWFNTIDCDGSKSVKPTPAPVVFVLEVGLTDSLF